MANYDNNIVNGPDLLSESQPDMLSNFQAIADLIAVNHYPFNDPNQGKHLELTQPVQIAFPVPSATEVITGSTQSPLTNRPEWGATSIIGDLIVTDRNVPFQQPSWSSSSALIIKTLQVTFVVGLNKLLFPTGNGIPPFTQVLNVQLSIISPGAVGAINGTATIVSFDFRSITVFIVSNVAGNGSSFGFEVMAIGF